MPDYDAEASIDAVNQPAPSDEPAPRLWEVAGVFLKLGMIAFGGPAAHIAMMRQELVRRRGWVTDERFLDLVGAINLIPGPNSTELTIHLGYDRARRRGLITAGVCFITPAFLIVLVLVRPMCATARPRPRKASCMASNLLSWRSWSGR